MTHAGSSLPGRHTRRAARRPYGAPPHRVSLHSSRLRNAEPQRRIIARFSQTYIFRLDLRSRKTSARHRESHRSSRPVSRRIAAWRDTIDVNLTGVWNTCEVSLPTLLAGGRGGSIVITSSSAGIKGTGTRGAAGAAYAAAKRGCVGLMQVLANAYASDSIRVNTIHPTGVISGMTQNSSMEALVAANDAMLSAMQNALPIEILEARDISNFIAWLVSDEGYYLTGAQFPLDAGFTVR